MWFWNGLTPIVNIFSGVTTHKISVKIKFYDEVKGTMALCNVDVHKHFCVTVLTFLCLKGTVLVKGY